MSRFCEQCGREFEATDKFCRGCGATRPDEPAEPPTAVTEAQTDPADADVEAAPTESLGSVWTPTPVPVPPPVPPPAPTLEPAPASGEKTENFTDARPLGEGQPGGARPRTTLIALAVVVVILAAGAAAFAALQSNHKARRSATRTEATLSTASNTATTSSTSTTSTSTTTKPALPPGACVYAATGVQLMNGVNLSCPFAQNIVTKLIAYYKSGSNLQSGPATFDVASSDTHLIYSVTCSLAGSTITCHNNQSADADKGGNNDVVFPKALVP